MTTKQRNRLLVQMTDDVARLVLAENYSQTQAISIVVAGGAQRMYEQARFIDLLEQSGRFDRELAGLPEKKALTERLALEQGLTKPEVSVLLAYSKMAYYEAILDSDIPDDPFVQNRLNDYFPSVLAERFDDEITQHRLRREIIATVIAGNIGNHIGPGVGFRVREEVGSDIAGVASAYIVVSEVFEADGLWRQIEALDNQVAAAVQIEMLSSVARFLEQTLTTVLRSYKDCLDMAALCDRFHDGVAELAAAMPKPLAAQDKRDFDRRAQHLIRAGVPRDLARAVSVLVPLAAALDIVEVARAANTRIGTAGWVYSALGHTLDLEWVEGQIAGLSVQTHWHLSLIHI
mgnify:FL=1